MLRRRFHSFFVAVLVSFGLVCLVCHITFAAPTPKTPAPLWQDTHPLANRSLSPTQSVIVAVEPRAQKGQWELVFKSNFPLPRTFGTVSRNEIIFELPDTKTSLKTLSFSTGWFEKVSFTPLPHSGIKIAVKLRVKKPISTLFSDSKGGYLTTYSTLHTLSQKTVNKTKIISLIGSGILPYRAEFMESPRRLILDFPNTVSGLPLSFQTEENPFYSRIRTSQFELNPAKTRVVVELSPQTTFKLNRIADGIQVMFDTEASDPLVTKPTKPVPKPKPAPLPLAAVKIVIDPGHGGDDPGAIGEHREFEKDFTLDISKTLQSELEALGAEVLMCRSHDENPTLEERTVMANINKATLFVSVHINSFILPFSNGSETYYYKPQDKFLSECVHEEIVKTLQLQDKGVKRARLYVLRNSTMPAVLIEPLFITNSRELELLKTPSVRQNIAKAVTRGVLRFVKNKPK